MPFLPTGIKDNFDLSTTSSDIQISPGKIKQFAKITIDTDKIRGNWVKTNAENLLKNGNWKKYTYVSDNYSGNGLFMDLDYVKGIFDELQKEIDDNITDFNIDNYTMVFAELGNKVTEAELIEGFDIEKMKLDIFNIYMFPNDFLYPKIEENRTDNGGIDIDVGSGSNFTSDVNLRSMLEYVMVDINKGDVRSAVHGSKRSLYYEYEVDDGSGNKITKYLWIWPLANPIPFLDSKHVEKNATNNFFKFTPEFCDTKSPAYLKKVRNFGRNGTFLEVLGYGNETRDNYFSKLYSYHVNNLLLDTSVMFNTSSFINAEDNALMNIFRSNSGIFLSIILNFINNQNDLSTFPSDEANVLQLLNGRNQVILADGETVYYDYAQTIAFYELPNFQVSYYNDDLLVELICEEVQSSTLINGNEKADMSVETILTVIKANENVYQQFLSSDNKLIIQPPQFRPLASEQPKESLIVRNSNSTLHFRFRNIKGEALTFIEGDKVYLEFDVEPTGSDGGY